MQHAPPPQPGDAPPNNDVEHLRLLSIFHYIFAGMSALWCSLFIFHVVIGVAMLFDNSIFDEMPQPGGGAPPMGDMKAMGAMFAFMGGAVVLAGWTYAVLLVIAGRKLAARRGRTFCIVVASLSCFLVPLGTILGVFTLIVLMRPSVQTLFEAPPRMQPW